MLSVILSIMNVAYPVQFANYQRNSFVFLSTQAKGENAWVRDYLKFNAGVIQLPQAVLINKSTVGVMTSTQLLVFDAQGSPRYHLSGPAIFGERAIAYVLPSRLMNYQDYEQKLLSEALPIPNYQDWTSLKLLIPRWDEILAAVQFTGGPQRRPRWFSIALIEVGESLSKWSIPGDGIIDQVLASKDEKNLFVLQGETAKVISAQDGSELSHFAMKLKGGEAASLDHADNLVVVGKDVCEDAQTPYMLKIFSKEGKLLNQSPLSKPHTNQPPACGTNGHIFLVDEDKVKCIQNGCELWEYPLVGVEDSWITVLKDNAVLVVNSGILHFIDSKGKSIFRKIITLDKESFTAPASVGENGNIYVASNKHLYCFK
jgi:hypothetical protein